MSKDEQPATPVEPIVHRMDVGGVVFLYDEDDVPIVEAHSWYISQGYALTEVIQESGDRKTIGMHRLILGDEPGEIDHINRIRNDNRRSNLRRCTHSQNMRNIADRTGTSSRFRGVSKVRGKWQVVFRDLTGKLIYGGCFATEEEAAEVAKRLLPEKY